MKKSKLKKKLKSLKWQVDWQKETIQMLMDDLQQYTTITCIPDTIKDSECTCTDELICAKCASA